MGSKEYDVLIEKWIPVIMTDSTEAEYGMLEFFENAHKIKEIDESSPLVRYGMMRLMIAFVTDVFRPESANDLSVLFEAGCFDMEKIKKYTEDCKNEMGSNCFDLFDEKYPFLQSAYDERYDKKDEFKSVATLIREIPKATSHIHFVHATEDEHAYSPAVCARGLCSVNTFALAGGQGYSTGINGGFPPWFVLIKKENLFETIISNTVFKIQIENSPLENNMDSPPVVWRDKTVVEPKKLIPATSYLRGLTWTARRLSLVLTDKGGICSLSSKATDILIKNIRYTWGWNCNDIKGRWRDPHVGYSTDKKGEVRSIKPLSENSAWRNLGGLVFEEYSMPTVVSQYIKNEELNRGNTIRNMELELFGMTTDGKEKVHEWFNEIFSLSFDVIKSNVKSKEIKPMIENTEETAKILKKQLNLVFLNLLKRRSKSKSRMSDASALIKQAQIDFFSQQREYFFDTFLPKLAAIDTQNENWRIELHTEVNNDTTRIAKTVFNKFSQGLGTDSATIFASIEAEKWLAIELSNLFNPDNKKKKKEKEGA